ncbi:MAG TPA: hypothetical protein VGH51_09730, partial [Candidatus Angelobacter sp.]
ARYFFVSPSLKTIRSMAQTFKYIQACAAAQKSVGLPVLLPESLNLSARGSNLMVLILDDRSAAAVTS